MAYQTGVVNSLADIQTAIRLFLVDNGWTWDGVDVIHKGDVFVRFSTVTGKVLFTGRTSIGSGSAPQAVGIGHTGATGVTFPATYWAFLNDDEFYFVLNYDVVRYQYIMWGQSTISNIASGASGMYISGTVSSSPPTTATDSCISIAPSGNSYTGSGNVPPQNSAAAPFWDSYPYGGYSPTNPFYRRLGSSYVHTNIDTARPWELGHGNTENNFFPSVGNGYAGNLQSVLPNVWNGESPLLPLRAYKRTVESKVILVVDLQHARQCRVDNFADQEIVSIGLDQWQVFPFHRRNMSARNGGLSIDHTGTFGWAIRKVD